MASLLSPRLLRRGLELFALASVIALVALLIYGNNWRASLEAVERLRVGWVLAALALASSDWWGGGFRLWLLARFLHRGTPLGGMIVAGGLNTWGCYLTPSQTAGGPVMIWAMTRYGVPLPEATIAAFMSFVGTVVFFAIAGPLAIVLGAGRSLRQHGVPLVHVTLYDVFKASAWGFVAVGVLLLFVIVFPGRARALLHAAIGFLERRGSARIAGRVAGLREGIDRMQACVVKFLTPAGWLAMLGGVVTSSLAHANKLMAAWVVLRMLGIQANLVDVLLVQTTISFLLYFAPTPGGAGAAEALSAALMGLYVPRALVGVYTLLWRFTVSYATVIVGSFVFFKMLHGRLDEAESSAEAVAVS
ncbi:MAG TPA: lysylphosphatidylglycerol synthase transmembrane domain-containing protein [Gemmatimonadales bacterium]|nr:lysylphosphatidylglycerol synthase transmembrane domain-containing protein [Gemmatimonadales bacterium]